MFNCGAIYLLYRKATVIVRRHEKLGQATLSAIEYHSQSKRILHTCPLPIIHTPFVRIKKHVDGLIVLGIHLSFKHPTF